MLFRLALPKVVPRLLVILLLGPLAGGVADAPDVVEGDRSEPVLWVHGIYPTVPAGMDYGSWDGGLRDFRALGWDEMWLMGLYACDRYSGTEAHYVDVGGYGPTAADRPEHKETRCGGHGHGHSTSIEHLSLHWAWAAADILDGRCGNVVAHSMGGLVVRHALWRIEAGDPAYPPLCISAVATLGTPHGGAAVAGWCPGERFQACQQMHPDSALMQRLQEDARHPGVGTRWLAVGSEADLLVPAEAAMDADHRVVYHWSERVGHTRFPSGNYIDHGMGTELQYSRGDGAVVLDGEGPLRLADRFFAVA